jgi:hypothetical protein
MSIDQTGPSTIYVLLKSKDISGRQIVRSTYTSSDNILNSLCTLFSEILPTSSTRKVPPLTETGATNTDLSTQT